MDRSDMTQTKREKKSKPGIRRICLPVLLLVVLAIGIGTGLYLSDYYHADASATAVIEAATTEASTQNAVTIRQADDCLYFEPAAPIAGLVFYPGGKVAYESYAPLMEQLAEQGILCILPHLTGNIAFLEMNAADGLAEQYPEITDWYLGGHSLGGVVASSYAGKHAANWKGLILLAAYSTTDLTGSGLQVLSIYGSCDGVLSMEAYEKNKTNLPAGYQEQVIEGGCHAWYGNYGAQNGDGTPTITREEQQAQTVEAICSLLQD